MELNALGLLVGGTLLLSIIMLIGQCLSCRRHPNVINQHPDDSDYTQPSGAGSFIVPRPGTRVYSPNDTLSPWPRHAPSPLPGIRHISEDGADDSSQDYVNNSSDEEESTSGRNYIVVLPESVENGHVTQGSHVTQSKQSLCPSGTSEDHQDYINVEIEQLCDGQLDSCDDESDSENGNYQNVEISKSEASSLGTDSCKTRDSITSESADYVNVPEVSSCVLPPELRE